MNVGLIGNPNCGKTSLFNELTGARQHVGNWPGVTVEKKVGKYTHDGKSAVIVDLPGTYSLGAYSEDELVARNYIIQERPEVVIDVADATNLERNLYLTVQLLEMGIPLVLAVNMMDEAQKRQIGIDIQKLSQRLGIPVVATVAPKRIGIHELMEKAVRIAEAKPNESFQINYGETIEREIDALVHIMSDSVELKRKYHLRWVAIKLLENDKYFLEEIKKTPKAILIKQQLSEINNRISQSKGEEPETLIIDKRYQFISKIVEASTKKSQAYAETLSDRIDRITTSRIWGIPIFALVMYSVFSLTFALSDPMIGWIETFFGWLGELAAVGMTSAGVSELMSSFVVDGVVNGVGSILVFIPPIFMMFLFMSLLEDSGYMARAAYVMDRLMRALGLHGKSFISYLIGFGCNVPGVMGTRTLESRKDRMIAIMTIPFMSCMARLPIYVLLAGAFFTGREGIVIFSLYVLGIVLAVMTGKILSKALFKGDNSHFVMELPPYRIPTIKGLFIHMWEKGSSFIRKAGTVIFSVVVIIWVLSNLPAGVEYASADSYIARLGGAIAPIFQPAGFGTWEASAALLFGVLAKEVVVGTFGVISGAGEDEAAISSAAAQYFTPLSALTFMIMTLIYMPCVATVGAIKRETNSWRWTLFAVGYTTVLGWFLAVGVFQIGKFMGFS